MTSDEFEGGKDPIVARVAYGQTPSMASQKREYNIGSAALLYAAEGILPDYDADHTITNDSESETSRRGARRGAQNPVLGLVADAVQNLDGMEVDSEATGSPLKSSIKARFDKLKGGRSAEDILQEEKVELSSEDREVAKKLAENIKKSVVDVLQEKQVDVQSTSPSNKGDEGDKFIEFVVKTLQDDVGVVADESKALLVEGILDSLIKNPYIEASRDELSDKISSAYERVQSHSYQVADLGDESKGVAESVVRSVKERFDFGNEKVADKAVELVAASLMESGPIKQLLGDNPADDNAVLALLSEAVKEEMDIEGGSAADLLTYLKGVFETVKESSYKKNLDGFSQDEKANIVKAAASMEDFVNEELVEKKFIEQMGENYKNEGLIGSALEGAARGAAEQGDEIDAAARSLELRFGSDHIPDRVASDAINGKSEDGGHSFEDLANDPVLNPQVENAQSTGAEQAADRRLPLIKQIMKRQASQKPWAAEEEPDSKRQKTDGGGREGR